IPASRSASRRSPSSRRPLVGGFVLRTGARTDHRSWSGVPAHDPSVSGSDVTRRWAGEGGRRDRQGDRNGLPLRHAGPSRPLTLPPPQLVVLGQPRDAHGPRGRAPPEAPPPPPPSAPPPPPPPLRRPGPTPRRPRATRPASGEGHPTAPPEISSDPSRV